MFYDVFCELCADKGESPSGVANKIGFNRATVTTWKNTGKAPKGAILSEIAEYFEVPVDFLLQRPPFEYWNAANADRKGVIAASGIDRETLYLIWGINDLDPYSCRLRDFISFMNIELLSAVPTENGGWQVTVRPEHRQATDSDTSIKLDDFTFAMQHEGKTLTEMDKQILISMAKQLNEARKNDEGTI